MPRRLRTVCGLGTAVALLVAAAMPGATRAESWCADPLRVHEWGVQVFGTASASGAWRTGPGGVRLPRYFHDRASSARAAAGPPVRGMEVDGGERDLPILHFYAPGSWLPAAVGIEVGFTRGEASAWYPQVDVRRSGAEANGPAAASGRARLIALRRARQARPVATAGAAFSALPPADPTRQLEWDNLMLTRSPRHALARSSEAWVDRLRGLRDALWANSADESERFVFYEARTSETRALRLERGPAYASGRRHLIIRNVGRNPVFDVFLVHREAAATFVFYAPSIPANTTAGLLLEQHRTTPATFDAATRGRLRRALVDAREPRMPSDAGWDMDHCVMQRDPALPMEAAEGHRLYEDEVRTILDLWGARFFDAPGTTLVYREDTRYLDEVMPLSIYASMYHHVRLRRAGLALIENVRLP